MYIFIYIHSQSGDSEDLLLTNKPAYVYILNGFVGKLGLSCNLVNLYNVN